MKTSAQPDSPTSGLRQLTRADWRGAIAVGSLALALYVATACTSIFVGDSAEIAGAAATFGVPHPPGYGLFTPLTGLALKLLVGLDLAYRANLVVAFYGSAAVALLALLVRRLGLSHGASWFAALALMTGRTFWSQCVAAEVYSFDALLFFASLHGACAVMRVPEKRSGWIWAGAIFGAWIGHRTINFTFAVPVFAFFLAGFGFGALKLHARSLLLAVVASLFVLAFSPLYLVLASRAEPWIDVGDPETPARLWDVLSGAPYRRHLGDAASDRSGYRLGVFFTNSANLRELGLGFYAALVALLSALRSSTSMRGQIFALLGLVGVNLAFASRYAVLDQEVFFLPAWCTCALLAAFGWEQLAMRVTNARLLTALALTLGLIGLPLNFARNDLSEHTITRTFADALFESLPERSIFFVNGDTSIHVACYLQAVEAKRPDVTVVSLGHIVPWQIEQLRARHTDVAWPELDTSVPGSEFARALMLENIERHPICFSPAINTQPITRPEGARAFELFSRGCVRQVYFTGQSLDLRKLIEWNLAFDQRVRSSLGKLPMIPDMDSRSTLLQFALSLSLTARRAQLAGWRELEQEALEACLAYQPDLHERAIHNDVKRGLGLETPLHRFGHQARSRLRELGSRPGNRTE